MGKPRDPVAFEGRLLRGALLCGLGLLLPTSYLLLTARCPTGSGFELRPAGMAAAMASPIVEVPDAAPLPPRLAVFRKAGERVERLQSGDAARSGDLLQLAYDPMGAPHGVLLSVDGRGKVTLHLPSTADASTALPPGPRPLPFAFELDDAPSHERFVLITGARPFDVSALLAAAGDAPWPAPDDLPPGTWATSFVLRKTPPAP